MKFLIRFLTLTLALLVSACGTYSPLKHQDKQTFTGMALGEVRVNKEFQVAGWFDGAMSARQGANVASLEPGIAESETEAADTDADLDLDVDVDDDNVSPDNDVDLGGDDDLGVAAGDDGDEEG